MLIALGALLVLTGCSDFVDQDQAAVVPDAAVALETGHTVGQTFVARHGGLNGIELWLEPQPGSRGVLRLHLRADSQSSADLAEAMLSLDQVTAPGFHRFSFPPDNRSHGVYRYAFLELEGTGAVRVGAASGEAYLDGAAYRDHDPLDAQLAFRLTYDPWGMALELGRAALEGLELLAVAALLYLMPGYALLAWLWHEQSFPWPARMGLAAGLSLALYPLLFLWTDLVGLHLGPLYAWGPVVLSLLALAWRYRHWRPRQGWEALRAWARSDALWPDLTLVFILTLVFGVRLLVVRTLDAPMWGDSYQHTMIAQLLVDNGGLFDSWEPYTPYRGLTVHFGFSATTALLSWMTGMEVARSTLLVGQILNGLAVLTLYPLAQRLAGGNRWAGVGAVLIGGLLSPMPAYYVNWGRFAQMAGQAVLPVALWLLWDAVDRDRLSWSTSALAALALGGMALHYYRMPFYYATFVLAWLVGWGLPFWRLDRRRWLSAMGWMALVAGFAVVLVLPWGSYVAGGRLAGAVEAGMSAAATPAWERVLADYQVWRDVAWYIPRPLLVAAILALLWSLARRQWAVAACALWVAGLAALVAGRLIRLPGANLMQNFAILIALYIPVGLMVGWLLGEMAHGIAKAATSALRPKHLSCGVTGLVFLALALGGLSRQMRIVDPRHIMVTRPDLRAMAWIRENVPQNALFLVEGFRIYEGRSVVGADAGWWIPLLARRANTMPPQYALLNETPAEPEYSQRVVDLVAHLEEYLPASPEGLSQLCRRGITHVYIGQGEGKVGAGAVQLFAPGDLNGSPTFRPIYHRDRVWIFALNPEACGGSGP